MIIVPISAKRQREIFTTKSYTFNAKPAGKREIPAPPHLSLVARRVAACGPMCGLAGRRWGTDTTQPIWARVGELFGAPKAKQEKGVGLCPPHPGHFCPQCGQLRRSTTGVVEGDFRRAVGSRTEMIPQLREKLRGRGDNSRRKAEMTNNKEKYAFWLTPEAKKMIEINAPLANCGSQSEFVEKAVRFYDGYLKVQTAGAFLPHAVADVLEGTLGVFETVWPSCCSTWPWSTTLPTICWRQTWT